MRIRELAGVLVASHVAHAGRHRERTVGRSVCSGGCHAFVTNEIGLISEATFEGQQIVYNGEVGGQVSTGPMPAGGYVVTSAEWCY